MWTTIDRACRRLVGGAQTIADVADDETAVEPLDALTLTLGRVDLDRLIGVLEGVTGTHDGRPDTPARIEAGLKLFIARTEGSGRPTVVRRPPGLSAPEAWELRIADADERTRTAIDAAIRGGEGDR